MIVIVKIITRLIVHWFIIIRLVLTKVIMECGSMKCPFGLPAKWLRKGSCGVRIYDVCIWPTGQMAKKGELWSADL